MGAVRVFQEEVPAEDSAAAEGEVGKMAHIRRSKTSSSQRIQLTRVGFLQESPPRNNTDLNPR